MKTIISHFYNEEYLLPWWLNHHKKYFDRGIMIDYNSTDKSTEIIKAICPDWEIIATKNSHFDAGLIDREVEEIEKEVKGWRVVLNTTEFIVGHFKELSDAAEEKDILIPAYIMTDSKQTQFTHPDPNLDLVKQRQHGASFREHFNFKHARKMSNYFSAYPLGRHYNRYNTDSFRILWYGFSPMNDELLKRKLQIQNKMSDQEKQSGLGSHHLTNRESLIRQFQDWQTKSIDLSDEIEQFLL